MAFFDTNGAARVSSFYEILHWLTACCWHHTHELKTSNQVSLSQVAFRFLLYQMSLLVIYVFVFVFFLHLFGTCYNNVIDN